MPTFSKDSWHARLYDWTYAKTPPKNLCPYFWTVVLAFYAVVLFYPMAKLAQQIDSSIPTGRGDWLMFGIISWIPPWFAIAVGFIPLRIVLNRGFLWYDWFLALGIGSVLIAVGVAAWFIGRWAALSFPGGQKTNGESLVVAKFKATKNKVCPQINWTDVD